MSGNFSAYPRCVVEIYPWEGGFYEISGQGGHVLGCNVSKPTRSSNGGFTLQIAPNSLGTTVNSVVPDWTKVITPMSFILIGMQRGDHSEIVLAGVVTSTSTTQDWMHNNRVTRTITVRGRDFSQFFDSFNWSLLGFLSISGQSVFGEGLTGNADAGIPATQGAGLLGGVGSQESNPAVIGQNWYTKIMAGTGGILAKTDMGYKGGGRLTFTGLMSTIFQPYPNVFIPFYDNFLAAQGNWTMKFRSIFPAPWYEFFVTTSSIGFYGNGSFLGQPLSMAALPGAPAAGPVLVARVNPIPRLTAQSQGAGVPFTLTGIDATLWNALPLFAMDGYGFHTSTIGFSIDGVRNAYTLNPTALQALYGGDNSNTSLFFYSFSGAVDVASVHRYGYRPEVTLTEWLYDPTGAAGANQTLDIPQSIATLVSHVISQYHPSPLMAAGAVVMALRPDIMPGCKFEYAPYRGGEMWTFYIEDVEHNYTFGGDSFTTLTLSRGLPSSIYADMSQKGIFYGALTGTAERFEGAYALQQPSTNNVGLTIYGAQPDQIAALAASIAQAYANPQTP